MKRVIAAIIIVIIMFTIKMFVTKYKIDYLVNEYKKVQSSNTEL